MTHKCRPYHFLREGKIPRSPISFSVSEDTRALLDKHVHELGLTKSAFVEELILSAISSK